MIQREKRYVEVDVRFSTEGRLRPLQIIFDKGQVYKIDKIKDICRRAADVGGVGDRYTCMIQGKERELWFEDGRWFVAAKVAASQAPPSNARSRILRQGHSCAGGYPHLSCPRRHGAGQRLE